MTDEDLIAMHEESLCPELQAYVTDGPLGSMIAHPLVHSVVVCAGLANRQLELKRNALAQAEKNKNWGDYLFIHERPYRTNVLLELRDIYGLEPEDIAPLAAQIWTDTENIHQHLHDWADLFDWLDGADWMRDEERATLADMPEHLTIFRGECNDGNVSWTLEESVAQFFADRETHNGEHVVSVGTVAKRDVYCYLARRDEYEIIVPDRSKVTLLRSYETKTVNHA